MYQSKLIICLSKLDPKSFKGFRLYVQNALGEKNQPALKLMKILSAEYPSFTGKNIDRSVLFKKIFPGQKENPQKLRYVMTDVSKMLETYLITKEVQRDDFEKEMLLTKAYRRLGLSKYQVSGINDLRKILENSTRRDARHYLKKYVVEEELFRHHQNVPDFDKGKSIEHVLENLDAFYLIEKLKYICELLNRKSVRHLEYDTALFKEVTDHLSKTSLDDFPVLEVYYTISLTFSDFENPKHFNDLKRLLREHKDLFSRYEIDELYTYARNYCIRRINRKDNMYLKELFSLYQNLLEDEILIQGKYLDQWDYKNINILGSKLEEFEWVEKFLEDFKEKLNPDVRVNAYVFNKAYMNFGRKNYYKTIELLQQVQFTDTYYHLDTKVLLLKAYYELNEIVPLFSLLDSFKILLRRNKQISEKYRQTYLNFIKVLKKLVRMKLGSKKSIQTVLQEMEAFVQVGELNWLKEKCMEFELEKS